VERSTPDRIGISRQADQLLMNREPSKRFDDIFKEMETERKLAQQHSKDSCKIRALERVVKSPKFEVAFSLLIVMNSFVFACQAQIEGWDAGARNGLTRSAYIYAEHHEWRAVIDLLEFVGNFAGVMFCIEVVLKVLGLGLREFIRDWWNWFDTIIVLGWLLEDVIGDVFPLDPRTLRTFRLLRLLRVLRILRTIQLFDSLYLLSAAFRGSVGVLTWSLVYLAVMQISLALILTEAMHSFYLQSDGPTQTEKQEVYDYFGTCTRATLTMFEMTLANWPPVCRVMAKNVGEWWVTFALVHKLTMGFAFIGIFNGVVFQETFKAASQDVNVVLRDRQRTQEKVRATVRELFQRSAHDFDSEGEGGPKKVSRVNLQEFVAMCSNASFKVWLTSVGLSTRDAVKVFHLLDGGDGKIGADDLVNGVERLRGVGSGLDLQIQAADIKEMVVSGHQMWKSQEKNLRLLESGLRSTQHAKPLSSEDEKLCCSQHQQCESSPNGAVPHERNPEVDFFGMRSAPLCDSRQEFRGPESKYHLQPRPAGDFVELNF